MSTLKVSTISPLGTDATKTITLGESGGTLGIASGAKTSGFGKVGQVLNNVLTTQAQTTSNSYSDTGLTVSITPTTSTSKILVVAQINVRIASDNHIRIKLVRGSTDLQENAYFFFSQGTNTKGISGSFVYLDSPSAITEQVYKFQYRSRDNGETVEVSPDGSASNMVVQEILD